MQLRVLDHKRFLEAMQLPERWDGKLDIDVKETEGMVSRLRVEMERGHVTVKPATGAAAVECSDVVWASIATGDLTARMAMRLGLLRAHDAAAINLLDAFGDGPVPYCEEYF
jgi:predicted acetyltransferase